MRGITFILRLATDLVIGFGVGMLFVLFCVVIVLIIDHRNLSRGP